MGFKLQKFNSKRRKAADKMVFLIRMITVAMALALIPIPMKISATEEKEVSETGKEPEPDIAPQEPEETSEASEKEETEPDSTAAPKESESQKETEPETAGEEETEPDSAAVPKESESQKETEPETAGKEETEPDSAAAPKESGFQKETEPETAKEETKEASAVPKESEPLKETETEKNSREPKETAPRELISREVKIFREEVPSAVEIKVPLYNYEVVNIVAPAKYAVALNPYKLAVKTGENEVSTEQVVSRNYGILNKSSTDKIVSVTFLVEDLNGGEIEFVDSAEEAQEADEDSYAVYLAAVPADDSGIWVDGEKVDCNTTAADLSDVEMNGAADYALPLGEGENTLSFKLSKAVYNFEDGRELALEEDDGGGDGSLKLLSLASGEGGITAFTFTGAMNPKADWGKLLNGIRISAVYTYETATGEEEILEGTGAVIETE